MKIQITIFCALFSLYAFGQVSGDQVEFQRAVNAPTDSAKYAEIEKFIVSHPTSKLLANAYAFKFQLHFNKKEDSAAYSSIKNYLGVIDQTERVSALNAVAFEFAQRQFYIDSALSFINEAIASVEEDEPVLLNTKSLILYRIQHYEEADMVQTRAVSLLPEDAEFDSRYVTYFVQLGFIQLETNNKIEGMQRIILSNLVLSKQHIPVGNLDSLITTKISFVKNTAQFRDSLFHIAIKKFLVNATDTIIAKSNLAVSLARNKVLRDVSLQFAEEAYTFSRKRTIEERSGGAAAYGLTLYNLGEYAKSEKYLSDAAQYAPPNESEIFLTLADVKEKLGKKHDAFDALITAASASRQQSIYAKLIELKNELYPTQLLDSIIAARQAAFLQFTPEKFERPKPNLKKNQVERVVLAELFTGSECRPCQAADIAFDYLIERYNSTSLAILEYHLHVPLPDPLTNSDTEDRAEFYSVNSTPTVIIGGTTSVSSGGSKLMARSKFYLFSDIIELQLEKPTTVSIGLNVTQRNKIVTIRASASSVLKNNNLKLFIALVEDEVFYRGANGIEHHKFVVRKMFKPQTGYSFLRTGKITINESINLNLLTQELKKYSEETQVRFEKLGSGLREMKYQMDSKKLAVVAFVQDIKTREVLQAKLFKVP